MQLPAEGGRHFGQAGHRRTPAPQLVKAKGVNLLTDAEDPHQIGIMTNHRLPVFRPANIQFHPPNADLGAALESRQGVLLGTDIVVDAAVGDDFGGLETPVRRTHLGPPGE